MDRKDKLIAALAVTGAVLGAYSFWRISGLTRAFNTIIENYEEFKIEMKFDDIVAGYDDEGDI